MKYLLHRMTALLLAVLLLCSAGGALAFATQTDLPNPRLVLGTEPADMLSGGGQIVRTERGDFYVDGEEANICLLTDPGVVVVPGPAAKLNYADGVLYFARVDQAEGCFDLCAFDLDRGEEAVLLSRFAGKPGQVYLAEGKTLYFSCDNAVWTLDIETRDYSLYFFAPDLWSFVPTACGLVYATGTIFDYSLYAGEQLLAEHVESYYVDFDLGEGALVYSLNGDDFQLDLASAFRGLARPTAFAGYELVPLSADGGQEELSEEERLAAFEAEMERLSQLQEALLRSGDAVMSDPASPPDPEDADPNDPQLPPELTEPAEDPTEPAPAESDDSAGADAPISPDPTDPAPGRPGPKEPTVEDPAPAEESTQPVPAGADDPIGPAPDDPAPAGADDHIGPDPDAPADPAPAVISGAGETGVDPMEIQDPPTVVTPLFSELPDGLVRAPATLGQLNIVRRARQMLNIRWTPRQNVGGWGYYDSSYSYYNKILYKAGVTYTGLPYGQGLCYVPWSASLSAFAAAVKDLNSKMYTTRCSYSRGSQYYGTDCSGFVSWAWDLPSRTLNNNTSGMARPGLSTRIGSKYTLIEVGDALIREDASWSHSRLVTDVIYDSAGIITAIEVSEANPTLGHNGCAYSTVYTGAGMQSMLSNYGIYRSETRNSAGYAHDCAVPLDGDYCTVCGFGVEDPDRNYVKPGVDVSYAQGTIDWTTLAPQISFALVRVGYTGTVNPVIGKDSYFEKNVQGCKANEVPYGIYFYAGATTPEQAMQEAEAVLEYLGYAPDGNWDRPELPIFYDVEENNNILKLTDTELVSVITAFCSTIENFGLKAGVYASTSVWNTRLTSDVYNQWVRWVAQWESSTMTAQRGAHVWQYAKDCRLAGVSTIVDTDYWMGEVGNVSNACSAHKTEPSCEEPGILSCTSISNGETLELPITPLGHLYMDGVCTRCGAEQPGIGRFVDVSPDAWYAKSVAWAVDNGITKGTTAITFSPGNSCTRAQIMTFLWAMAGRPEPGITLAQADMTDVPEGAYYTKAVLWALERGITSGATETSFDPDGLCTRAQAVCFLWRYAGSQLAQNQENPFEDVAADAWYRSAVLWAKENGITKGITTTSFGSNVVCSRGQIVTFLHALWQKQQDDER